MSTTQNSTQNSDAHEQRLERMESAIAHLQHDLDAVNQSLLGFLRRIQEFESRFTRLEQEFQSISDGAERRDPAAERPPHY
ncbi:MAG: SlyX family protein [Planctomycetaceae bacterium]